MRKVLNELLLEKEFDEEFYLVSFIKDALSKDVQTVFQSSWKECGKYLFESDLIITLDGKHFKLILSMFGNNPRDDFHYIKTESIVEVVYKQKVIYTWEEK